MNAEKNMKVSHPAHHPHPLPRLLFDIGLMLPQNLLQSINNDKIGPKDNDKIRPKDKNPSFEYGLSNCTLIASASNIIL